MAEIGPALLHASRPGPARNIAGRTFGHLLRCIAAALWLGYPRPGCAASPPPVPPPAAQGEAVLKLQNQLAAMGYPVKPDGYFGNATEHAVEQVLMTDAGKPAGHKVTDQTPAAPAAPAPAAPAADSATCTPNANLRDYDAILQTPPTPTKPANHWLPDDGAAKLYFHHPLGTGVANQPTDDFFVFESPWLSTTWRNRNKLLSLITLAQASDTGDPAYQDTDSVEIQFQTDSAFSIPWHQRSFVVIDCEAGKPVAWGSVRARVTDSEVAGIICGALAAAVYLLSMLCLQDTRAPNGSRLFRAIRWLLKTPRASRNYFAATYPSVYRRQEISILQLINPIHLTVNEVGVPSVQKFQVILFSSLVVGLLLYLVLRIGNLVSLSSTVVGLIGISGVSAAISGSVSKQTRRLSFDNWSWLEDGGKDGKSGILIRTDQSQTAVWGDLFTTNHDFDIYKMQTLVFSAVVAIALVIAGAGGDLDTFTVPDALLGVLGLSQVTYISGLLAQPPSVADLDAAITKLRDAKSNYLAAINRKTDVDNDGHMLTTVLPASAKPGQNAKARFNQQVRTIIPMIESALEVRVNRDSEALQEIP